jgi:glycosyltransferase involved in cell wall biosynthesis
MGRLFTSGQVNSGDHFIFTDAWHPGIINLKYMSELLGISVKIHALWHAGSYDPADFLGRLIGDEPWCRHAEHSFFAAVDHNYFATEFHIDMFCKNLLKLDPEQERMHGTIIANWRHHKKIVRMGWPMEYMPELFEPYTKLTKRDLVLFPHRIAPEKQVEMFRDLADSMPEYEFVVCQDQQLTKDEYHTLLGEAKLVFSANLQETLGISCYEGALCGASLLVPDRLSYQEMYTDIFKYPTEYTDTWVNYIEHKEEMMDAIRYHVDNHESMIPKVKAQARVLSEKYFSAQGLLDNLG